MTTPFPRNPIRIARGLYSDLYASLSDLKEGEICFAQDTNTLYVKENGVLTIPNGGIGIENLIDVNVASKTNGSILYYDQSNGEWIGSDVNTIISLTDGGNF
jgi:hypothetical protein